MPYADPIRAQEAKRRYEQTAKAEETRQRYRQTTAAKESWRRYRQTVKAKAFAMLGGQCVVCGESDLRLLTINHKNGDGRKDRPNGGGPRALYQAIDSGQRSLEDLDVRCYNHNILYEYEIGRRQWDE